MNPEEMDRALRHCHAALGETLMLISDVLAKKGEPDDIIRGIEKAQAKYNAITRLLREQDSM